MTIKVCFDTNVFNRLIDDREKVDLLKTIFEAIKNTAIEPYISETIFTLEAIPRKDRKNTISDQKLKINTETFSDKQNPGQVNIRYTMETGDNAFIHLTKDQKRRIDIAKKLGFKILKTYRIGGFINKDIRDSYGDLIVGLANNENEKFGECARYIEEELDAGLYLIKKLYNVDNFGTLIEKLKNDNDNNIKKISEYVAEWADGDSLAASVAYKMNYFCTNDQAKRAGQSSVFYETNKDKIENKFSIKIISSEKLCYIISNLNKAN